MHPDPHFDTIVIGAGLAGLTAAARLAQSGHRVAVLERNSELGGRARTDDLDGWLFNHGAHALYNNGVGHRTLRELGIEPDGVLAPQKGNQLAIDGRTAALPSGPVALARTRALSTRSKIQLVRLLTSLPKLDTEAHAAISVDDWLSPLRVDAQQVIKAIVRLATYSADTSIMSADAAIRQLIDGQKGVLYLHGGWATMCAQIARNANEYGATILPGTSVESITNAGDIHTVHTRDKHLSASALIVAAGGPKLTASLLGIDEAALGPVGPPVQASVLDLALDSIPSRHQFVLAVDEPTYFSVHSPPATMAPAGKVAAVAMRYLATNDDGSAEVHRASLERIAELAGATDPVRTRFLRRMTVTNAMPTAATGGLAGRPAVKVADSTMTYIAGDWVGPRGLLADAAIASGNDAAADIARTLRASPSATLS